MREQTWPQATENGLADDDLLHIVSNVQHYLGLIGLAQRSGRPVR